MKRFIIALATFAGLLSCGQTKNETSDVSSIVRTGTRWPNPSAIPVCIMNRNQVSDELFNDVKNFVTEDYHSKTSVRFTGFNQCTAADLKSTMIRVYFKRTHDWSNPSAAAAGGGLSWLGPVASSCGAECGGGTMYIAIGTSGSYPPSTSGIRQYVIDSTRNTAVHEFGHAVGLAHEHDRADAPQCGGIKGTLPNRNPYVFVGSYDPASVMNYCKSGGTNRLSAGDVAGIRYLYPDPPSPVKNGAVVTLKARHSSKCVDVAGGNLPNGTSIQQYDCNGTNAQKFQLFDSGNGSYYLRNVNSKRCVDVSGTSTADGALVHQWDCVNAGNQKVRFVRSLYGAFQLRFEHTGKCLDVKDVSTSSGAAIQQWSCINNPNQDFFVTPTSL